MTSTPPLAAYSIDAFCEANHLGKTRTYEEIREGRLKTFKVGKRRLISFESAAAWRRLMESLTEDAADAA